MDELLGIVKLFAGNFAPRGWMFCAGQTLQISEYSALYSLLGTFYGGNGVTTFNLPDLRGRVAVGYGSGPGLTPRQIGEKSGYEGVSLVEPQMPAHSHGIKCDTTTSGRDLSSSPENNLCATESTGTAYGPASSATMAPGMVIATGGGQPHENMQPYLVLNYIICINGIFPSRS